MNRGTLLFVGVFLTFASAWMGLVFFPSHQLKDLRASAVEGSAVVNPPPYSGQQELGREVYIADGCVYCHTQQVRGGHFNADLNRGWGRRSIPQDYIWDRPALLGTMRTGPDLLNIAARQNSEAWHDRHLYNPLTTSPGSIMPPHPFLFIQRPIAGQPSANALTLESPWQPRQGYEVVPNDRGKALVAYLLSLDRTYEASNP